MILKSKKKFPPETLQKIYPRSKAAIMIALQLLSPLSHGCNFKDINQFLVFFHFLCRHEKVHDSKELS